jgi:hypothetical protein
MICYRIIFLEWQLRITSLYTAMFLFLDSKDDDKIVKYHWEEKRGPLQDHQIQDDTAMLTLKGLAPGVYIFE